MRKRQPKYCGKTMIARDMFRENARQVFDLVTGEWIKTISIDEAEPEQVTPPEVVEIPVINKNQLSIF